MSIVEKALAKAQTDTPKTPDVSALAKVIAAPRREPVTPMVPARTGGNITLDLEHLRREGVLPPRALAHRTTDEYRRIKWPVLDIAFGRSRPAVKLGNIVIVTSAVPGEGKTFSAVNLAFALALERDCSVLLVDSDLARPRITQVMGLDNRPGLVDALVNADADWRSFALATDVPGLAVLPAGRPSAHGAELLASKRMETVLQDASHTNGQIVIVDSAPLLATNEAQVLARLAGQLLVVVRANSTSQAAVNEAVALLDRTKPIGLILNQARSLFGDYNYGYYNDQNESAK